MWGTNQVWPGSGLVLGCLGPGFTVLALGPGFRPIIFYAIYTLDLGVGKDGDYQIPLHPVPPGQPQG